MTTEHSRDREVQYRVVGGVNTRSIAIWIRLSPAAARHSHPSLHIGTDTTAKGEWEEEGRDNNRVSGLLEREGQRQPQ